MSEQKSVKQIKKIKSDYIKKKISNYYAEKAKKKRQQEYMKKNANKNITEKSTDKYFVEKGQNKILVDKYNKKRGEDVIYRIIDNMVRRISTILKEKKIKKTFTYRELFGCSPIELRNYLKSKFIDNMSFGNYPEWEVDHIKPISKFDLTDEKQLRECFHYTNLQPLWKIENLKKWAK